MIVYSGSHVASWDGRDVFEKEGDRVGNGLRAESWGSGPEGTIVMME